MGVRNKKQETLKHLDSITLGLSSVTGGAGIMYFDDIRLYAP